MAWLLKWQGEATAVSHGWHACQPQQLLPMLAANEINANGICRGMLLLKKGTGNR